MVYSISGKIQCYYIPDCIAVERIFLFIIKICTFEKLLNG